MRKLVRILTAVMLTASVAFVLGSCSEPEHSVCHFTEKVAAEDYLKEGATCAHSSIYYYSCECGKHGEATFESGETLPHSFTSYSSDKNATCTKDGTKTAKCDNCSETNTVTDSGTMTPHSFTNYVYNGNATCGADGTKTAKCDGCDATNEIKAEKTKIDHEYSNEWSKNETHHWNASLCEHGAKANEAKHEYEGGVCKICGQNAPDVFIESFTDATINGTSIFATVGEAVSEITVADKIICSVGAEWELYSDAECQSKIDSDATLSLASGNNVYYVKVFTDDTSVVYTVTIHRSFKITVTYKYSDSVLKSVEAYSGTVFTADYVPDAIPGYTFDCWMLGDDVFTSGVISSDITLDAFITPNVYTITLNPNGGNITSTEISVTYGESYTLASPKRSGYTFSGWFDESGAQFPTQGVWDGVESITLIAKWTKVNGGGSGIQMPFYPLV